MKFLLPSLDNIYVKSKARAKSNEKYVYFYVSCKCLLLQSNNTEVIGHYCCVKFIQIKVWHKNKTSSEFYQADLHQ